MLFAAFVIAIFAAGDRFASWLWNREAVVGRSHEALGPMSRLSAAALFGFAFWVAINWALSPVKGVRPAPLLIAALVVLVGSAWLARRVRQPAARDTGNTGTTERRLGPLVVPVVALCLTCLLFWLGFVMWRGWVMFPLNHDALSYHLPKAIHIVRHHGFGWFEALDPRIATMPSNYEMLLADMISLTGSDRVTEWVGSLTWITFLLGSAALAERWWGRGLHVLATAMAVAAIPLVLLHSGADKNDLMQGAFMLLAVLWGTRWVTRGDLPSAASTIVAVMLAFGTKPHAAMMGVALAIPVLLAARRRRRLCNARRPWLLLAGLAVASFVLLGGISYVFNLRYGGGLLGAFSVPNQRSGYGQWENLLWYPYMALTAPFSASPLEVWVPWRGEYWFWPRYEPFFSHFGAAFTVFVAASPLLWVISRRSAVVRAADGNRGERRMAAVVTGLTLLFTIPIRFEPFGFFAGFSRYFLFAPPVLLAWAVPVVMRLLGSLPRGALWAAPLSLLSLGGVFVTCAIEFGQNDRFAPLEAVIMKARGRTFERWIPFQLRAPSVIDQLAGPTDTIAVDGQFDIWVYPLYGKRFQRKVVYIQPGPGPVVIPEEADWVVVDRSFEWAWTHPLLKDFSSFLVYGHDAPARREDLRVPQYCEQHPETWQPVVRLPEFNWAYRRIRR